MVAGQRVAGPELAVTPAEGWREAFDDDEA